MKKYILDLKVKQVEQIHQRYVLIKLTDDKPLPDMLPGQFVEVRVDGSTSTFLRRPISINFVDRNANELWLLVATVGDGTRTLAKLQPGDTLNCVAIRQRFYTCQDWREGAAGWWWCRCGPTAVYGRRDEAPRC